LTAKPSPRIKPSPKLETDRQAKRKRQQRARGRPRDSGASVGADAIVREVCELLREFAPRDVTLLRVAQHAGVDRSLIRYYFKNRSSLLLAAARHLFAQLQSELAGLQSISPEDP
jgi:TetR/AcrR family transcriptional regulator